MLTKGAIGNLINRYKAVLKKCHLLNTFGSLAVASMLIMGAAGVAAGAVAQIGNNQYESLAAAVDAAQSGDTIVILQDVEDSGVQIDTSKKTGITIDLGGHEYTVVKPVGSAGTETNGFQLLKGGELTIKNGTITAGTDSAKILIQKYCDLTLDNVTLNGKDGVTDYTISNNNGTTTIINGSVINSSEGGFALDAYDWPTNGYGNVSVIVDGSAVNGRIEMATDGTLWSDSRTHELILKNTEVSNQTTVGNGGALIINSSTASADIENVVFNENTASNGGAIWNRGKTELKDAVFTGNTAKNKGGAIYNAAGSDLTFTGTNIFSGNTAADTANDIYNAGNITVNGGTTILEGGLILADGTVKVADGVLNGLVTWEQHEGTADKALITVDSTGASLNGGMAAGGTASVSSTANDKGRISLDGVVMDGNKLAASSNSPLISGVAASLADGQSLAIDNSLFTDNSVTLDNTSGQAGGAGVSVAGTNNNQVSVSNTDFIGNTYKDNGTSNGAYGGAMGVQNASVTLNSVDFKDNSASSEVQVQGAGYYQSKGSLHASDLTVSGNKASSVGVLGTGMGLFGTSGSISGATFADNVSTSSEDGSYTYGGGLYLRGSAWGGESDIQFTVADSTFARNAVTADEAYGAGLSLKGEEANTAADKNGHIALTLNNVSFDGNTAEGKSVYGGGMYMENAGEKAVTASLEGVTFKNNSANGSKEGFGGALYNGKGSLTVADSTFTGNTASTAGGAIYNAAKSDLTFTGTNTFTNNTANGVANDVYNAGSMTVESGVTRLDSGYTQEGENSVLKVNTGATLAVAMPDMGGVTASKDEAMLALGDQITLGGGKLRVGNVAENDAHDVAFGSNSVLVVDGKVSAESPIINGESGETLSVADGSKLYIANAQAGEAYTITDGLDADGYWKNANLLAGRLIEAEVSQDGDSIVVETEAKDAAKVLPGIIPVAALDTMVGSNLNDTDSASMGIRFLSRAMDNVQYMPSDATATAMVNEVSRAAVTAGVQNTALRLADAGVDQLTHHLSLSFFGKENSIHKDGVDIWATPMYGNTYTHGMVASGTAVRGNYGGVTLGADAKVGEILGGKVRVGAAINGGGGKSETRGTATSTDNEYNFGGVNLYAGWNLDSLNVMASVGYAMANHDVKMNLPAAMGMGQAKADVDTNAFIADLRAEYQINTDVVDILPHAGVRYTALNTESHDLKVNGSTLNSVASDTQHIVQFPLGVTVSKDIDISGWNVKPQADVSVIPAAGEKKNTTKVSYAGIGALDSVNTRIMDSTSWAGMVGVQAEKGNFALGLNYGVQASSHETDQSVSVGISWKF